jgi:hypothetical protein
MPHVILLGDSIFDNGFYVAPGAQDVVRQVRDRLPENWTGTLRAVDGSVISDVEGQLRDLPPDTTHLVISAGGNDALDRAALLDTAVGSVAEALERIGDVSNAVAAAYVRMLESALAPRRPAAVCTIYDVRFPEAGRRKAAAAALAILNDRITRAAFSRGLSLIDLRLICDRDEDFANPIEPSEQGGAKIANAITSWLLDRNTRRRSHIVLQ